MQSQVSYKRGAEREERQKMRPCDDGDRTGGMQPQAKKSETEKSKKARALKPLRERVQPSQCRVPGLQDQQRLSLCCFCPQACAKVSQRLQETDTGCPMPHPGGQAPFNSPFPSQAGWAWLVS